MLKRCRAGVSPANKTPWLSRAWSYQTSLSQVQIMQQLKITAVSQVLQCALSSAKNRPPTERQKHMKNVVLPTLSPPTPGGRDGVN
jgi:hypothetical protein